MFHIYFLNFKNISWLKRRVVRKNHELLLESDARPWKLRENCLNQIKLYFPFSLFMLHNSVLEEWLNGQKRHLESGKRPGSKSPKFNPDAPHENSKFHTTKKHACTKTNQVSWKQINKTYSKERGGKSYSKTTRGRQACQACPTCRKLCPLPFEGRRRIYPEKVNRSTRLRT